MKKVKRWRYYCGFCKKSGAQGPAMLKHEQFCTMNPDRQCRMCDIVGAGTCTAELVELVKGMPIENGCISGDEHLSKLREASGDCPACMLSALRQAGVTMEEFNYEKEVDYMWKGHNQYGGY